ncbi:MAG: bifunctional diguanylate cyclase/phosphodiesterase [Clostridia bacterium]
MNKEYFEQIYNDTPHPCVISDRVTNEVVFMNDAMQGFLEDLSPPHGTKCYQVIHHSDAPCGECDKDIMGEGVYDNRIITHELTNKNFNVTTTMLGVNGKQYNMCKYALTKSTNPEFTFEHAMTDYASAISNENPAYTYKSFLEILGKFYSCSQSYLYKIDADTREVKYSFSWNDIYALKTSEILSNPIIIDVVFKWVKAKKLTGVIQIDFNGATPTELNFLQKYDIENMIISPIFGEHDEIVGVYIGINSINANKYIDTKIMKVITNYTEQAFKKAIILSELMHKTDKDSLTNLYSRRKYAQDLEALISSNHNKDMGVIFANLNGLRQTNENLGYSHGDQFIQKASKILSDNIDEKIYRTSGDEFVIFFEEISEEDFLENVDKLHKIIANGNENLFAIGHAYRKGNNIDILKLVSEADNVMYINKQEYYQSVHKTAYNGATSEILSDLINAIDNDEFLVYLQPKFNLSNDTIAGAEALVRRFNKKDNRMVYPDSFIEGYEKVSIIRHVDICVLNKVCKMLSSWGDRKIPISVNLSRVTLLEHNIVDTVDKICKKHDIPPQFIIIEITERVGLVENNIASKLITDFKERGFALSLDDFGCAYSNIVTLAKIDVDEIKIDKSLIDEILINPKNRTIVENLLKMCASFENTHVVAEGIEMIEQADVLREFGCSYGQGYHYSKPITSNEFYQKYVIA